FAAQASAAFLTPLTFVFRFLSKQTPLIRVAPAGQPAVRFSVPSERAPATSAFWALTALGTVPSLLRSMSVPSRLFLRTFDPVTALLAILPVVTALDLSCREPTEFFFSCPAAHAVPPKAAIKAMIAITSAGEGRPVLACISEFL